MQGSEIKKKLLEAGFVLAKVAVSMGESPQNFDILLRAKDVKSGTIERICKVINKSIDFFYSGNEYKYLLPEVKTQDNLDTVSLQTYEKKVEECALLKAELKALKEQAAQYAAAGGAYSTTTIPAEV